MVEEDPEHAVLDLGIDRRGVVAQRVDPETELGLRDGRVEVLFAEVCVFIEEVFESGYESFGVSV